MLRLERAIKIAAVLAVVALGATMAQAITVTTAISVPNFSFENGSGSVIPDGAVSINGGDSNNVILADWNLHCATYAFAGRRDPGEAAYVGAGDPNNLPSPADSVQSAFMQWGGGTWTTNGGWSTITSIASLTTIEADMDYVLNVAIGTPLNCIGGVSAMRTRILVGGSTVAETTSPIPAKGAWDNSTVTLTKELIASNPTWVGLDVTIQLAARHVGTVAGGLGGRQIDFDNVRLGKVEYLPDLGNLTINKFFDCDQDGVYDVADADKMLSTWNYTIKDPNDAYVLDPNNSDPNTNMIHTTNASGQIALTDLAPGDYTITETVKNDHVVSLLPGDPNNTNPRIVTVPAGDTAIAWFGNWLVADVNQDGIVDSQDFSVLKANFGISPGLWTDGNINLDSLVDSQDFSILKANFGKGVAPGSAGGSPVPEPATMLLLGIGAAGVLIRKR